MLEGCYRTDRVLKYARVVLRAFVLRVFLQLDLLVKEGQSLAIVLGVPSQSFKAVDLVFELDQQLVIQREVIDLLYFACETIP